MRRRAFLVGAIAAALAARASAAVRRLAIFAPGDPAEVWRRPIAPGAMLDELAHRSYVEGGALKVEIFGKEENAAGLEALAAKIVASKPDVIFVAGVGGVVFKRLTTTIPIVALSTDLVGQGLVQSLARPGGNITGVAVDTGPSIWGKRIALLRELVPASTKLALVSPAYSASQSAQERAVRTAAEASGTALAVIPIKYPSAEPDYQAALEAASRQGADSLLFTQDPQTVDFADALAKFAAEARLPALYPFRENVEAGGLMAYSEDMPELFRRAGAQIAAILDGANPADVPAEQPSSFVLSINLKTAAALGVEVAPTLLAAADEVIE